MWGTSVGEALQAQEVPTWRSVAAGTCSPGQLVIRCAFRPRFSERVLRLGTACIHEAVARLGTAMRALALKYWGLSLGSTGALGAVSQSGRHVMRHGGPERAGWPLPAGYLKFPALELPAAGPGSYGSAAIHANPVLLLGPRL